MDQHIKLLGKKATDCVTGFKGTITSVSFDLYGCIQAIVTPDSEKGEYKDGRWLDVNRLKISKKSRAMTLPTFPAMPSSVTGPAEKPLQ